MITHEQLKTLKPCEEGLTWASQYRTLQEAWEKCQRSDWMWWLLRKLDKCPKELSIKYSRWCADSIKHLRKDVATTSATAKTALEDYAADDAYAQAFAVAAKAANVANAVSYVDFYAANAANAAMATVAAIEANDAANVANYALITDLGTLSVDPRSKQANYLRSIVPNPFAPL